MNIGISTGCLYPMLTEESVGALTEFGFQTFEIFFNSFSELESDYLFRLNNRFRSFSARVAALHPFTSSYESFLLFSNYERRFEDGLTFYERYFRAAKALGADKVILHGLSTDYRSSLSDEEYFCRFDRMQRRAKSYGVTLLQENVTHFRSGSNDFLKRMSEQIPDSAAFVCDTKQAFRSGTTPTETAKAMGSGLRHVHISGRTSEGECVLPGKGCFDTEEFIKYLIGCGYNGDVIIEVYRFSYDDIHELIQAKDYIEGIIRRIETETKLCKQEELI